MVDRDEHDCGGQARGGEAVVAVDPDEIGGEPGRQGAQQVVGDVEQPDVPGVAVADPLRDDDREHERDEQRRREHERAGDDERGRRVEAVVAADGDAEQRREGGERQQDRRLPPLVARGDALAQRGDGGDERERLDHRRVDGRRQRAVGAPAGTASPPAPPLLARSSAPAPRQGSGAVRASLAPTDKSAAASERRYPFRGTAAYVESGSRLPVPFGVSGGARAVARAPVGSLRERSLARRPVGVGRALAGRPVGLRRSLTPDDQSAATPAAGTVAAIATTAEQSTIRTRLDGASGSIFPMGVPLAA